MLVVENSKIEWCDHTFNPWTGCQKVSPACDNCYAEGWAKRTGQAGLWNGERRRTSVAYWREPAKWNRDAERDGVRRKVFCASLADVFDNKAMPSWRADLFDLIFATPHLDWLLLTKRPQNIRDFFPSYPRGKIWPNIWLGTTVENQVEADRRIPHLLLPPAAKRFLSCEPLLGPVDLIPLIESIDWVIAGGESGPNARPMHPDWARSLRNQCQAAGVPFFFKQWGEHLVAEQCAEPDDPESFFLSYQDGREDRGWSDHDDIVYGAALDHRGDPKQIYRQHWASGTGFLTRRVGKKAAGAMLDGREWREAPV